TPEPNEKRKKRVGGRQRTLRIVISFSSFFLFFPMFCELSKSCPFTFIIICK
ncbi:hypothetical protein CSUI_004284, partial [Cystoisospora suis]